MLGIDELTDWAERIIDSLGDTGIPPASIVNWFQGNLYKINSAIGSEFCLSGELDETYITPDMTQIQSGIYEEMYYCDFLKRKAITCMGAAGYTDWIEMEGEKQGKIRLVSRNERAKTFQSLSKDQCANVDKLVDQYLRAVLKGRNAFQVLYNERGNAAYDGVVDFNSSTYFSIYNTIFR